MKAPDWLLPCMVVGGIILFIFGLFGVMVGGIVNAGTVSGTITNINSWEGSDLQTFENLTLSYGGACGTQIFTGNLTPCTQGTVTVDCNYYHVGQTVTFTLYQNAHFFSWFAYGPLQISYIDNAPTGCYIQAVSGAYQGYF